MEKKASKTTMALSRIAAANNKVLIRMTPDINKLINILYGVALLCYFIFYMTMKILTIA